MRFDRSIVDIHPRRTFEIIDLALHFYRDHLPIMLKLTLLFGLPAFASALVLTIFVKEAWLSVLVFWMLMPLSSGVVILAASRLVFGVSLNVRRVTTLYRPLLFRHFGIRFVHRSLFLLLLPFGIVFGELLRLRWAFSPMIVLLERLEGKLSSRRRKSLTGRGGATALGVDIASLLLAACLTSALAFVADLVFSDIVSLWEFGGMFEGLSDSPTKISLWLLIVLVVTPIVDLAWFFFYLDARIRREGWDLELGFRAISARLEHRDREAA